MTPKSQLPNLPQDQQLVFFSCTIVDGIGTLLAAMLPVGLGVFMTSWRSTNSNRYTSCDVPDSNGNINALSAAGPWPFASTGYTTAPPSVRTWEGTLSDTAANLALKVWTMQR